MKLHHSSILSLEGLGTLSCHLVLLLLGMYSSAGLISALEWLDRWLSLQVILWLWASYGPWGSWCSSNNFARYFKKVQCAIELWQVTVQENWSRFLWGNIHYKCHKPVQSKVSVITGMLAPACKKQVQSFIGMINYLSKFSPTLSEFAEPIRELSKDKVPLNSRPEHQEAFKQTKRGLLEL